MKQLKELYGKYIHILAYLFFGVCTTLTNMLVFWLCNFQLGLETVPSTILAWIAAVLFAYLTNRKWVFHSEASGASKILIEIFNFFACRIATGLVDWIGMWVLVDLMHFNSMLIKFILNIAVIVLNYIASRLIIFRHKGCKN